MGTAVSITRTEQSASELRSHAARCDDAEQARRLLALAMVLDAAARDDAARMTGMDRQTLRDWVHRYNAEGIEGLRSRKAPGPSPKLTVDQRAELRQLVLDGPDPEIHKVIRWRCVDLRDEVLRRFNVAVDQRTVAKWLCKMKMTRLQPRPFHPKKDAEAAARGKSPQQLFRSLSVRTGIVMAIRGRSPC
jgi:transposase